MEMENRPIGVVGGGGDRFDDFGPSYSTPQYNAPDDNGDDNDDDDSDSPNSSDDEDGNVSPLW